MILRPSSSEIWTKCYGQPQMVERHNIASETSDAAKEGTCAAWVAEMVLTGQRETCFDMIDELHPDNHWPVDYDMADYIQKYVDHVRKGGGEIFTERKVVLNENIQGTPDSYAVLSDEYNTLYVDDLKYGFVIVSEISPQIVIYAEAICRELQQYHGVLVDKIRLGIYQPRGFHVDGIYRHRTVSRAELALEAAEIENAGRQCLSVNPKVTPGEHCKYCPAQIVCSAAANEIYKINSVVSYPVSREMTGEEISREYAFLNTAYDMIKGRKSAIEDEIIARQQGGGFVPGWLPKSGHGRRKFKFDKQTVELITGVDATPDGTCTPKELERRGADPDVIRTLTVTPRTKAKLSPVKRSDIAKAFGDE